MTQWVIWYNTKSNKKKGQTGGLPCFPSIRLHFDPDVIAVDFRNRCGQLSEIADQHNVAGLVKSGNQYAAVM